jgi:hypothetical protein
MGVTNELGSWTAHALCVVRATSFKGADDSRRTRLSNSLYLSGYKAPFKPVTKVGEGKNGECIVHFQAC